MDNGERNCWLDQDHFEAVLDIAQGEPHVQLTFDDGNASDVEMALPALLKRGLQATFFICTGRLDQPHFLSRAQIPVLLTAGMQIGSHGIDHVPWRHLFPDQLKQEIEGSRLVIENTCRRPVTAAACPFGAYDRVVLRGLRRAGYSAVYTSDGGAAKANEWLRARTTITRSMPLAAVRTIIDQGFSLRKQAIINMRKYIKMLR